MKNQQQTRLEFAQYFLDLRDSIKAEGGAVSKADEWDTFIEHGIEEGRFPAEAKGWKCPRSLEAEIAKSR